VELAVLAGQVAERFAESRDGLIQSGGTGLPDTEEGCRPRHASRRAST
jgi:hypothetical protein